MVVTKLTKGNGQNQAKELLFRGKSKEVNTVPVPAVSAGMYRTGMYTGIETSTFHTGLNTGRTGHTDQFRAIPAGTGRTGRY